MENATLLLFIPTFFAVSVTPGLCMSLAMTLGMTIGVRRTLWMMLGELVGVTIVSGAALIGVSALLLSKPALFEMFKYVGGAYILYLGVQMWLSKGKMAINLDDQNQQRVTNKALIIQGFVTAIANPKGWAFMVSLLPPFIVAGADLLPQATLLISIILCLEFMCLLIYAYGGRTLRKLLMRNNNVVLMNRIAGSMMMLVGVWLAVG
uniref:LysE family translocator n=1 Tax=Thaumasiovibrio occultus TaxID=1891184 RepID=UPI000B35F635|nr:LysE family translocator [Thaumasiovibrio occultus]